MTGYTIPGMTGLHLTDAPADVAQLYPEAGTWRRKFPWHQLGGAAYGATYTTNLDGKPIERRVVIDRAIINDAAAALWAIGDALGRREEKPTKRKRSRKARRR